QIHQRHIRLLLAELPDGVVAGRRLRDHDHVGLSVDDRRNAFAQQRMVVNAEDPDRRWRTRHAFFSRANATRAGTESAISVPARARLHAVNRAPIRSARSRMPASPQCPVLPVSRTPGSMPRPSSRTSTRSPADAYSSSISMLFGSAWRDAFTIASRP